MTEIWRTNTSKVLKKLKMKKVELKLWGGVWRCSLSPQDNYKLHDLFMFALYSIMSVSFLLYFIVWEFTVLHLISAEGSSSTSKAAFIFLFAADTLRSLNWWSLSESQTHSTVKRNVSVYHRPSPGWAAGILSRWWWPDNHVWAQSSDESFNGCYTERSGLLFSRRYFSNKDGSRWDL